MAAAYGVDGLMRPITDSGVEVMCEAAVCTASGAGTGYECLGPNSWTMVV